MKHQIVLGIGSNEDGEKHLALAKRLLLSTFDSLKFSEVLTTTPVDYPRKSPFLNQVAIGQTEYDYEMVASFLKKVEKHLGRTVQKEKEYRIPIDIDLIQWDDRLLKPSDMERDYIQSGLNELMH